MNTTLLIILFIAIVAGTIYYFPPKKQLEKANPIIISRYDYTEKQKYLISPYPVGTYVRLSGSRNKQIVISDTMTAGKNVVKVEELHTGEVTTTTWDQLEKWSFKSRAKK